MRTDAAEPDQEPEDAPGPVVVVCFGAACRQKDRERDAVRATVRATRGAVMIRTRCQGACALAPVVAVGSRNPAGAASRLLWFGRMDDPDRRRALLGWLIDGGPASGHPPGHGVPGPMAAAVFATSDAPAFRAAGGRAPTDQ